MNDFYTLAQERFSCRNYKDIPVENEVIDKIIDAALLAPTAVNFQPFKIFTVDSDKAKDAIKSVTRFHFDAPNFFIIAADKSEAWTRKFDDHSFAEVDASIVVTTMMYQITDLGLASCWVGYFDAPALKELCPELKEYELIAILPFGYAAENAVVNKKHYESKTKEEIVTSL